ncbi:BolA family transcriptional regulator [Rhodobacteraceae bacterium]|nr:BolA family transcriptional regulator [Paracoccaceae bacterium]
MEYFKRIEEKLQANFSPEFLEVVDESELHAGHSGARPEGETHFKVRMKSKSFEGVSRIDRQRSVHKVLKSELDERVHALSLELAVS